MMICQIFHFYTKGEVYISQVAQRFFKPFCIKEQKQNSGSDIPNLNSAILPSVYGRLLVLSDL